jgi:hypothetical protein
MNTSYYGNKTKAKDGFEYSSRFEAEFVDKFLIPHNIEYERQKLYSEDSKHRCDFYLPDYDLWIECVYEQYLPKKSYLFASQDIVLTIPYADITGRARAKSAGARWRSDLKQWIIQKTLVPPEGFPSLERYMDASLLVAWFDPKQVNLTETYNSNLKKKMLLYGDKCTIMQINNIDLNKKSAHIADLIRIKNNSLFLKLLAEKPHLIPVYEVKDDTLPLSIDTITEPEKENDEPEEVSIQPDGTVVYSDKLINRVATRKAQKKKRKEKMKERRGEEFSILLAQSTKAELEYFRDMIIERLSNFGSLAEKKDKEFPDK